MIRPYKYVEDTPQPSAKVNSKKEIVDEIVGEFFIGEGANLPSNDFFVSNVKKIGLKIAEKSFEQGRQETLKEVYDKAVGGGLCEHEKPCKLVCLIEKWLEKQKEGKK